MAKQAKGGKKQRKFERSKRAPSGKAYKNGTRWLSNKDKAIARDLRIKDTHAERLANRAKARKPVRGTARIACRANWQHFIRDSKTGKFSLSSWLNRNIGTIVVYAKSAEHAAERFAA